MRHRRAIRRFCGNNYDVEFVKPIYFDLPIYFSSNFKLYY